MVAWREVEEPSKTTSGATIIHLDPSLEAPRLIRASFTEQDGDSGTSHGMLVPRNVVAGFCDLWTKRQKPNAREKNVMQKKNPRGSKSTHCV
jgi:hypothetical protein